MGEVAHGEKWVRRSSTAAAVLILIAGIGIPYAWERAYRRWSREMDPLKGVRVGFQRTRANYQGKRDIASEFAQLVNDVLSEVAHAVEEEIGITRPPHPDAIL
jgi:hypothetical protein